MQHKQGGSRFGVFLLGLLLVAGGGVAVLMTRTIPAPQHRIEKQLDAKAFLEQKP